MFDLGLKAHIVRIEIEKLALQGTFDARGSQLASANRCECISAVALSGLGSLVEMPQMLMMEVFNSIECVTKLEPCTVLWKESGT